MVSTLVNLLTPLADPVPKSPQGSVMQDAGRGLDDNAFRRRIVLDIDKLRVILAPMTVVIGTDVKLGDGHTAFQFVREIANSLRVQVVNRMDVSPLEDFLEALLGGAIHGDWYWLDW